MINTGLKRAAIGLAAAVALAGGGASAQTPPHYHIVKRIPMTDGWWDYANFDPVHRRLFISRGDGVMRLDVDTGAIDPRIIPGSEGRASIVLPGGDEVLSNMAGYTAAILFDAETGTVKRLFDLRQAPDSAVYDPASKLAWIMGRHGEVTLLDLVALKAVGRIALGEELEFAVADGQGHIYVNAVRSAAIIVVDTQTRAIVGRLPMAGCEEPTGLAVIPSRSLLISACSNGVAKVLKTDGTPVADLPIGEDPDAVIYDPARKLAFIPSAKDGSLSVLAIGADGQVKVIERDPTQIGTRTGAIDSETGLLYLPTAKFGPPNKLGFPEPLKGSVELLVMAPGDAAGAP
jgi:hypothetical protein